MDETDQAALQRMREDLRKTAAPFAGTRQANESTSFAPHDQPHLVTFNQDCVIVREFGREKPGGGFEPTGEVEAPQTIKAGTIVQRGTGIWRVRVLSGIADFEKDGGIPDAPGENVPTV
jgi:hypothetical protein